MTSTYHACEPVGSVQAVLTCAAVDVKHHCCRHTLGRRLERLHGLAEEAAGESRSTVAILRACR